MVGERRKVLRVAKISDCHEACKVRRRMLTLTIPHFKGVSSKWTWEVVGRVRGGFMADEHDG